MRRHKFSFCKLVTKMNKKGKAQDTIEAIHDYHVTCRTLQLSPPLTPCNRDPVYGFTLPYTVFSHDQVPIACCDSNESIIENTGEDEVYNSVMNENDNNLFCSLNLTLPNELRPDGKNNPKPHVVFKASKFQTADNWHDQEERQQWDPRVIVSFHLNAWVDAKTHMHGLN